MTKTGRESRGRIGWSALLAVVLLLGMLAGCDDSTTLDPRLSDGAEALKDDQPETARRDFEKAAAAARDDPSIMQEIGTIYVREERWEDAAEWLAKAENRSPSQERVALLGLAYQSAGPTDRGCKDLSEAALKRPEDGPLLNLYAYQCLVERNVDLDAAISMLDRAAMLTHQAGYVIDSVGWAHYKRFLSAKNPEDLKEAIRQLERAATLFPLPDIRIHLIQAYAASEAPSALQPSLQYNWPIEESLGAAMTQLALAAPNDARTSERMKTAINLLEDATAKKPNEAMLRLHLGEAYLAIRDANRAYVEIQKALWLDSELKEASTLLKRVAPPKAKEPERAPSPVTL